MSLESEEVKEKEILQSSFHSLARGKSILNLISSIKSSLTKPIDPQKLVYNTNKEARASRETFENLQLSENDVHKIFEIFQKISQKHKDFISYSEVLQYLNADNSKFMKRIFRNFDVGRTGKVGFKDFLLASWNYCTLNHAALVIFAFDTYDTKNHGYINEDDLKDLVSDVFGSNYQKNAFAVKIFEQLDKMCLEQQDYGINIDQFTVFTAKHPNMLFPVYAIQNKLREKIVGTRFWKRQAKKRLGMSEKGVPLSIEELMKAHVHLPTFNDVSEDGKHLNTQEVHDVMLVSGLKEKRYREWKEEMKSLKEKRRLEKEQLAAQQSGPAHLAIGGIRVDNRKNYKERDKYSRYMKKNDKSGMISSMASVKQAAGKMQRSFRHRKEENRIHAEEKALQASEGQRSIEAAPSNNTHTIRVVQVVEPDILTEKSHYAKAVPVTQEEASPGGRRLRGDGTLLLQSSDRSYISDRYS